MNAQTHNAALRAAARVAFSVTLLGCGGKANDGILGASGATEANNPPEESGSSSIISSGKGDETPEAKDAGASKTHKDAGTNPVDAANPANACGTLLDSAFADAGWLDSETVSPDVRDCCVKELTSGMAKADPDAGWISAGDLGPHGWSCCQVTNWGSDTHDQKISMACTPWGPPVPPTMQFRSRARAHVA